MFVLPWRLAVISKPVDSTARSCSWQPLVSVDPPRPVTKCCGNQCRNHLYSYIVVGAGVMQQVSAVQSSTIIFVSAGLVYAVLALLQGPNWPTTSSGWWSIAGITIIATIIPVAAFLAGMKRIGPTDASLLSTLEPVVLWFGSAVKRACRR
jgi:hypothetical protein